MKLDWTKEERGTSNFSDVCLANKIRPGAKPSIIVKDFILIVTNNQVTASGFLLWQEHCYGYS